MKIGIFGDHNDSQCKALSGALHNRGVQSIIVDCSAIHQGSDFSYSSGGFFAQGQSLNDVKGWFLRYIISPLPPVFKSSEEYVLFKDWFNEYMHRQERYAFQLAMLLSWEASGIPVINPPEHGSVLQIKTFQLEMARQAGLNIPQSLVTNNPGRVVEFLQQVKDVVYKPSMGGALCRQLDLDALNQLALIKEAPVIFQEHIHGVSVRVTIVGEKVVSCVRIPSNTLDYREDPGYKEGLQTYIPENCPEDVLKKSIQLMRNCGLLFSGIDFILQEDGRWVFLEANSSPIYLEIENKTGVSITNELADLLIYLANDPQYYRKVIAQSARTESFVKYAFG